MVKETLAVPQILPVVLLVVAAVLAVRVAPDPETPVVPQVMVFPAALLALRGSMQQEVPDKALQLVVLPVRQEALQSTVMARRAQAPAAPAAVATAVMETG